VGAKCSRGLRHEVLVASPRHVRTKRRKRKSDRIGAHRLARGRIEPQSLFPVQHRSAAEQQDLAALRGAFKPASKKDRREVLYGALAAVSRSIASAPFSWRCSASTLWSWTLLQRETARPAHSRAPSRLPAARATEANTK
jgi:hypothetical protein